jgi:hypothetical protein
MSRICQIVASAQLVGDISDTADHRLAVLQATTLTGCCIDR